MFRPITIFTGWHTNLNFDVTISWMKLQMMTSTVCSSLVDCVEWHLLCVDYIFWLAAVCVLYQLSGICSLLCVDSSAEWHLKCVHSLDCLYRMHAGCVLHVLNIIYSQLCRLYQWRLSCVERIYSNYDFPLTISRFWEYFASLTWDETATTQTVIDKLIVKLADLNKLFRNRYTSISF
jgi:hypothetical protein